MADTNLQKDNPNVLAMKGAEEELRRRRERGKLSQARFRKKQAQVSQGIQDENRRLKAAIADIVRATQHSDRYTLLGAIRDAAGVAGVDASSLDEAAYDNDLIEKPVIRERSAMVRSSTSPLSLSLETCRREERSRSDTSSSKSSSASPITKTWSNTSESQSYYSSWRSSLGASIPTHCDPRLDYGIWVDASSAVRISKPPPDIVPFLGSGRYTFAGQLYWACADYIVSLCRVVTTPRSPSSWFSDQTGDRPNPKEAEDRLWHALQHTPPVGSVRLAQALAEAQLEFRDKGYIYGDSPASNENTGTLLRQEIEAAYVARGQDLSVWMNITELEKHMRRQLGSQAFSRLERAMADYNKTSPKAMDDGPAADPDVRMIVRLLMKNLVESYTCFGDGPRWRADCVSVLFGENMRM
ncbi:hypothetical protein HD806DRAFT_521518 [Xylariaceae sp. AK1471]|nr:hypothetical protein HD806DRAFT_521518 [Xylariaceae sp. AK1471]